MQLWNPDHHASPSPPAGGPLRLLCLLRPLELEVANFELHLDSSWIGSGFDNQLKMEVERAAWRARRAGSSATSANGGNESKPSPPTIARRRRARKEKESLAEQLAARATRGRRSHYDEEELAAGARPTRTGS